MSFNFKTMMATERIIDLQGKDKTSVLTELVDVLALSPNVKDRDALLSALIEREQIVSTGIGIGIAVPHVKISSVEDFVVAIGRSHRGVDFDALDGQPVHIIVMIAASDKQASDYLKVMAKFMLALKQKDFRRELLLYDKPDKIYEAFLNNLCTD
jgi:PTS system nitrogen regulatory IIA component